MSKEIKVSKFGGSSMKDAMAMKRSARIVRSHESQLVVVSATYGTTNQLLELVDDSLNLDWKTISPKIEALKEKHLSICSDLSGDLTLEGTILSLREELMALCRGIFYLKECTPRAKDRLQSIGERLSSALFVKALQNEMPQKKVCTLDVRDYLITTKNFTKAIPLTDEIKKRCASLEKELLNDKEKYYVTQGFIGKTLEGETTTLGRGGSDYSASLLGEALNAKEIQIWTDVTGVATTDPRICEGAKRIPEMNFKEAAEMATFGAKILHPTTLNPAKRKGIPVFVGSSYEPDAPGTWIKENVTELPLVRAVTMRTRQAIITICNPKMLQAHGFLMRIFSLFEKYDISVDAVTTSEISVAMTVDMNSLQNQDFKDELKELGNVKIENNYALVSLIGNRINHTSGVSGKIFKQLDEINIRMICQGASVHNFCILVEEDQGKETVNKLHRAFIK